LFIKAKEIEKTIAYLIIQAAFTLFIIYQYHNGYYINFY
jgi:hypothetical protein